MEIPRKPCRLCLSETEFNVSLFGNYSRRTNMLEKILVCLRLPIEENENISTICHKCAENVERYYDYINFVKKAQTQLGYGQNGSPPRHTSLKTKHENDYKNVQLNKRLVTVREQVFDADYTFSFLEPSNLDDKKEPKSSSPFFSYFSTPNPVKKPLKDDEKDRGIWKSPQHKLRRYDEQLRTPKEFNEKFRKSQKYSGDLFESQSQTADDIEQRSLDWRLTPDDNIIKRVREKCFGLSDF